ncbi:GlxA family transcriptional regulator [Streptomyces cocklensis]|jgi:transcriptional regulator GlxA family with amidase domain|uniref:Transcriptional regulator, AraC family with amidase-like domain n=1 Tax=Actinacidiphila cocklensis TaxID=887465 RepID=A0A9W4GPQ2_9ACTN|nr:GlxA family transcriptional regulator [Actinacidiphila cocklensis]MDD1059285.1 GlxA family transcriptional regulator [Actinacidiphila cocklensis]WSX73211.1 GlxA family transcriptional regulator [Streptomyces sp. NBC_00899]WSX80723.1 GlxA family transcriptional regulator [Streptomyces sp. NBC_00899]CAG6392487.1 Transcriptional regulator, AraC family with amidase-like domain [Actinacidiphila cocklensis]
MTSRRIVFAVFPGFQLLDLAGPNEVFVQAARVTARAGKGTDVVIDTVAATPGPVVSSGGLAVSPTLTTGEVTGPVDTLVAVGGGGVHQACQDAAFVDWFARTSRRARRTASVCSGTFLLGAAGLLDGRRVVTHWSKCERLAALYPGVAVDRDPIFVRDGDLWTSAGVTAGIDLALAMVEADDGPEVSRAVARQLVMFVQRPGGQAQFSAQLAAQRPERQSLRDVLDWIADHLAGDLSVPALAARAGMSERHFTRVFRAETGRTPGAYVESARVEAARRLLESTATTVEAVARACGYGTRETLQRSFKRAVQVTPGEYRRRFAPHSALLSAPPAAAR